MSKLILIALAASSVALFGDAFAPAMGVGRLQSTMQIDELVLSAAEGKKKRRRRKQPPTAPQPSESSVPEAQFDDGEMEDEIDAAQIVDVAKFNFDGDITIGTGEKTEEDGPDADAMAYPLPDIRQALRKKEMEEEQTRVEEEEAANKPRINRKDKKAYARLLEQQPYADADDSFFEEEEYGTVSALLGERAESFAGIPTGPLQVGHLIGALVIILMAFVEYPGFPLTNLPTPLRGALQGGLATVYGINIVLAVLAVFKAEERGQSAVLWAVKTFTVGGIAFDQLTQLPTTEEIEIAKAKKGKRALKNLKK